MFALKPYQARQQQKDLNVRGSDRFPSTPDAEETFTASAAGSKTASSVFIYMFLLPSETNTALNAGRRFHAFQTNAAEPHYSSIALPPFQHQLDVFNRGGGQSNSTSVQLLQRCLLWKSLMKRFVHAGAVHVCGGQRSHRACSKAAAAARRI